ncbi:MAG TPA: aminotransferase class I/II-fold pyridoxal phosphate-dependent enzyme [Feifaniaceae bacterium]|nr:aminotransferase class I/II-fold pyridoxal phosphate-dependent enzyme [Feifaniaceae bacterium]
MRYSELDKPALTRELELARTQYEALRGHKLNLNLTRGKPETAQLALSDGMFATVADGNFVSDGIDARNYGELSGLPACRKLFAEILLCKPEEVICGGNASLNLMYDLIAKAYTHGLKNSVRPWSKEAEVKFLCPFPGYDRHFNVSLSFGMKLIPVPMDENGPDMDMVEELVKDPAVKGMWCVPKFSNPDGYVYPLSTCKRIAALSPAAPDFALMWDNAYCIHAFEPGDEAFPDIITLCREAGHPDLVYEFASTSKVTYAGAGVSCMAASVENIKYVLSLMTYQTIGPNKVDELMHVRFLKDRETTLLHMQKHAAFMKPKFDLVCDMLDSQIAPLGIASWHRPKGGYFVSLNAMPGTAKRIVALCKEIGVALTGAGATYPGGNDPQDSNLRIAPSYPPITEVKQAMEVFCVSLRIAALEKLLA